MATSTKSAHSAVSFGLLACTADYLAFPSSFSRFGLELSKNLSHPPNLFPEHGRSYRSASAWKCHVPSVSSVKSCSISRLKKAASARFFNAAVRAITGSEERLKCIEVAATVKCPCEFGRGRDCAITFARKGRYENFPKNANSASSVGFNVLQCDKLPRPPAAEGVLPSNQTAGAITGSAS